MRILLLLSSLLVGVLPAGERMSMRPVVNRQTVTLHLTFEASPDNVWFCTQLASQQEAWTPRHCGPLSSTRQQAETYADVWSNMPVGAYDATAEMFRDHAGDVTEYDTAAVRINVK